MSKAKPIILISIYREKVKEYPSIEKCAHALGVANTTVIQHEKDGTPLNGFVVKYHGH